MAPHGDVIFNNSFSRANPLPNATCFSKLPPLPLPADSLQRTRSDITFEMSRVGMEELKGRHTDHQQHQLPAISEVEDAKCECCGMSEECTAEYIDKVRNKFAGKWICGLCSEAVKEEVEKDKTWEEALSAHMSACAKFKRIRAFPALAQADAMRQILKKGTLRAMSLNPRDSQDSLARKMAKPGIARSSSCIPAITQDFKDLKFPN
ncbi:hypothetical protein SAY86_025635 [Trapa natans]|uniref:DUF1677 family protein n=1 Tax=Trapa natans TaxID=22666 RepID=A0AAN7KKC5_TRANT|nr:hypothetical protein SAY86_025635 [Trapa natans]